METGLLRRLLIFVALFGTLLGSQNSLARVSAQDAKFTQIASQARADGESWLEARARFYEGLGQISPLGWGDGSAESTASQFSELDPNKVTGWANQDDLLSGFLFVRNERVLEDPFQAPSFMRRLTWLYPDDGCYARAAMMKNFLAESGYLKPSRVFIFGNLRVETDNSPRGYVTWWYHTAPVVRINGQVFVLDPAISPSGPMAIQDWAESQTEDLDDVRLAYCTSSTYHPGSSCEKSSEIDDARAESDQKNFLRREWNRQEELGRDPTKTLGDTPPWE